MTGKEGERKGGGCPPKGRDALYAILGGQYTRSANIAILHGPPVSYAIGAHYSAHGRTSPSVYTIPPALPTGARDGALIHRLAAIAPGRDLRVGHEFAAQRLLLQSEPVASPSCLLASAVGGCFGLVLFSFL